MPSRTADGYIPSKRTWESGSGRCVQSTSSIAAAVDVRRGCVDKSYGSAISESALSIKHIGGSMSGTYTANEVSRPREFGSPLNWKRLTKRRQSSTRGIPAGTESLDWVANTVTLIYGSRDAVLIDTFLSAQHTQELADWIAASGKNLTTIYLTHAHGDHFFGLGMLEERFPSARALAIPEVITRMRREISPEYLSTVWNARFPGQIPERLAVAAEIRADDIDLEGYKVVPVRLGHTDTVDSTCLHVPSLGLVVAGDAVYDGIHPYLAETNPETRLEWMLRWTRSRRCSPQRSSLDTESRPVTTALATSKPHASTFGTSTG